MIIDEGVSNQHEEKSICHFPTRGIEFKFRPDSSPLGDELGQRATDSNLVDEYGSRSA